VRGGIARAQIGFGLDDAGAPLVTAQAADEQLADQSRGDGGG